MARRGDGLYQRGNVWYLDFRHDHQRHVFRIGRGITRHVAREIASVKRAAVLKGEAGIRKPKDLTFAAAREKFEAWAEVSTKPRTASHYRECLRQLATTFEGKRLSEITSFLVEKHKQRRVHDGAPVRANRELAVLRALFNRCREWRLYEGGNPVEAVKLLREPKGRLRFLEPEEEYRLLEAAQEPLRTLILVCIHCGPRMQSEGLTLRWPDIDLPRGTLSVQSAFAKNGQTRTVPMNSAVRAALARLKAGARSAEYVFAKQDGTPYHSVRNVFAFACDQASLRDVTPHALRHTFATRLLEEGADVKTVAELGGWSRIELLNRYCHSSPSRKADAVERLTRPFHNAFHDMGDQPKRAVALSH